MLIPHYRSNFGQSFFSWQGNMKTFNESQPVFYFFLVLTFLACIVAVIYKTKLRNYYVVNSLKVERYFSFYGYFALAMLILRTLVLSLGGYLNTWELVPLHFCRFFLCLLIAVTILKKTKYIKYFGFLAINGALFGLLIPDLSNSNYWQYWGTDSSAEWAKQWGMEIGYDSFVFWDFLITHCLIVLVCVLFFIFYAPYYSKKEIAISLAAIISMALVMMGVDYSLSSVKDKAWQANWWYLSIDSINGIDDKLRILFGPLANFPYIFILFFFIGVTVYLGSLYFYFFIDKLDFCFIYENHADKKVTFRKSSRFEIYKNSSFL